MAVKSGGRGFTELGILLYYLRFFLLVLFLSLIFKINFIIELNKINLLNDTSFYFVQFIFSDNCSSDPVQLPHVLV